MPASTTPPSTPTPTTPTTSTSTPKLPLSMRRRSYCPMASTGSSQQQLLQPVDEARSLSPIFSFTQHQQQQQHQKSNIQQLHFLHQQQQQQQQQQLFASKSMSFMSGVNVTAPAGALNTSPDVSTSYQNMKQRLRAASLGSSGEFTMSSLNSSHFSAELNNTSSGIGSDTQSTSNNSSSSSNSSGSQSLSESLRHLIELEMRMNKSSNMFAKRDDWTIINCLPVHKQNTIHMRLEDEGPYGNDEIRCYVLSHFSSLGIKATACIVCREPMAVHDRFPLVDGTLFTSPVNYNPALAIPAALALPSTNKQQQQQSPLSAAGGAAFIYAVCLKCMMNEPEHEIKCRACSKPWQAMGGSSLQIGTLYKYDIFAAFPCCAWRLQCQCCQHEVCEATTVEAMAFSQFSEARECQQCGVRAFHYIRPLHDVYDTSSSSSSAATLASPSQSSSSSSSTSSVASSSTSSLATAVIECKQ